MSKIESWGVWSFLTVDIEGRVYYHVKCVCDNGDLSRQIHNFKSPQLWQLDNDYESPDPTCTAMRQTSSEEGFQPQSSNLKRPLEAGNKFLPKTQEKLMKISAISKWKCHFFQLVWFFRWLCWFHESLVVLSTSLAFLVVNCCKLQINCRCTPPLFCSVNSSLQGYCLVHLRGHLTM